MGVAGMRGALAAVAVSIAVGATACGGGGGPLVTMTSGGREDPGTTRDQPPDTRDEVGGNCLQCDVQYDCSPSANQTSIQLSTSEGTCIQSLIDLVCSGTLFGANGCSGGGGGPFTCGDVTCSPVQQGQQFPGGSSGAPSGSSTGGSSGSSSSSGGFADAGAG
jgi:hypothetical protein